MILIGCLPLHCSSARIILVRVMPSISAIRISVSSTSKHPCVIRCNACVPVSTVVKIIGVSASRRVSKRRFSGRSSTANTCNGFTQTRVSGMSFWAGVSVVFCTQHGSIRVKRLPCPGVLVAVSVPPIASARRREIGRPRPVPPDVEKEVNGSNIFASCSALIPLPESVTAITSSVP